MKIFVFIISLMASSFAMARSYTLPVEGAPGVLCERMRALYDRIEDGDVLLTVRSWGEPGGFPSRPGIPRSLWVGSKSGKHVSGEGDVDFNYVTKDGEAGFRMFSASTQYSVSIFHCVKVQESF